jgi:hypothetical protein
VAKSHHCIKNKTKQSHLKAVKRRQKGGKNSSKNLHKLSKKAAKKVVKKIVKKSCQKSSQKSHQKCWQKTIKKELSVIICQVLNTFSEFSYFWTLSFIFQAFITLNKI